MNFCLKEAYKIYLRNEWNNIDLLDMKFQWEHNTAQL